MFIDSPSHARASYIATNVTPAIPVVAAYMVILVVCFLFKTSLCDPGILPRGTPEESVAMYGKVLPELL